MEKNNQGHQTELVKRALVRYMLDSKLQKGDKLPTQAELRKQLNVGNVTIGRAVAALQLDGVLEARGKTGVFVCDAEADGYIGRHIGIACLRLTDFPFVASLQQCLDLQLHDHACQALPFLRTHDTQYEQDTLALYKGMRRHVLQQRIDGLITMVLFDDEVWDFFDSHRIPVCAVGLDHRQRRGVIFDFEYVVNESLQIVAEHGFQRPALIFYGYPLHLRLREVFRNWSRKCFPGLDENRYFRVVAETLWAHENTTAFGPWVSELVREFLAMPMAERPDALIIPDDILASGVYVELLQQNWTKHGTDLPELIFMRNRQIPMALPDGAGSYWECNIMDMAQMTVNRLLEYLQGRVLDDEKLWYRPEFHDQFRNNVKK